MAGITSFNPPRELNKRERDVLTFILAADFAGAKELRAQIPYARVESQGLESSPDDPYVDIIVSREALTSPIKDGPIPAGCEVRNDMNEYQGEILIWIKDGYLSLIEYAWVTDEMPTALPPVTDLTLV